MSFFLLVFLCQIADWRITGTDIFRGFTRDRVAHAGTKGWFLLDSHEQRILHYNMDGRFVAQIARQGAGPGEIEQANKLIYFEDHLFAVAQSRVWVFSSDGLFLHKLTSSQSRDFEKIRGGWLGLPNPFSIAETNEILVFDDAFKPVATLCQWEEIIAQTRRRHLAQLPAKQDRASYALSPDRDRLYLRRPGHETIEVWDPVNQLLVFEIRLGISLALEENLSRYKAAMERKGREIGLYAWLPELRCVPDGSLYFFTAPHVGPPLAFDANGHSQVPRFTLDELDRLIAIDEGFAFVADQDIKTDEFSLLRVPRDEVRAFLAKEMATDR